MPYRLPSRLFSGLVLSAALLFAAPGARADEIFASALDPALLFAVSGGSWQEDGAETAGDDATASEDAGEPQPAAGYFRLIAVRAEGGAAVYLQRIARTEEGFALAESLPIEEINALSPLVVDIRPDGESAGLPGFGAFVHLRTDPSVVEPETWSVFVDEFGDLAVSRGTN